MFRDGNNNNNNDITIMTTIIIIAATIFVVLMCAETVLSTQKALLNSSLGQLSLGTEAQRRGLARGGHNQESALGQGSLFQLHFRLLPPGQAGGL